MNTIKKFDSSFPSLTLHAVSLLLWKKIFLLTLFKIVLVTRPSTLLRVFFMRRTGCLTKEGTWGFSLKIQKFELPPSVGYPASPKTWVPPSLPWSQTTYWQKSISNSFQTNFTKNFASGAHFQLHDHDKFQNNSWN